MRIAIDCRSIAFLPAERPGIQRWNHNLLLSLAAYDKHNQYLLLCRVGESHLLHDYGPNFQVVQLPQLGRFTYFQQFFEQAFVPRVLKKLQIDVFLSLYYIVPLFRDFPAISLYDDMIPWILIKRMTHLIPDVHRVGKELTRFHYWKRLSARSANAVLAISHSTKSDLVNFWDLEPHKIHVNHIDIEPIFQPIHDFQTMARFRREYDLPEKYILYVASISPRKNVVGLLRAYAQFKKRMDESIPLVMVGPKGLRFDSLFMETLRREGLDGKDVRLFTQFVPRDQLPFFYNGALFFCYPSFYEGFGLTLLEALSCGVPSITARVSSLPEVAGDAAMYVDPFSVEEIADAMYKLGTEQLLRSRLRQKALIRARQFKCGDPAPALLNLMENLALDYRQTPPKHSKKENPSIDPSFITSLDLQTGAFDPRHFSFQSVAIYTTAPSEQLETALQWVRERTPDVCVTLITQRGGKPKDFPDVREVPLLPPRMFNFFRMSVKDLFALRRLGVQAFVLLMNNAEGRGYHALKWLCLIVAAGRPVIGLARGNRCEPVTWNRQIKKIFKFSTFPFIYLYMKIRLLLLNP